jgi:hypothetical protein
MAAGAVPPTTTCPTCSQPIVTGGNFCAFCGAQLAPVSAGQVTDAAIRRVIDAELATRLQDQNSIVRELGDRAEDVVWRRLRNYTIGVGFLLAILGWFGYSKLSDFSASVNARINPIVEDAVKKANQAAEDIQQSANKAKEIKEKTDSLSTTVQTLTTRVTNGGSDIGKQLAAYQAAQKQMDSSLAHAQALSQQVDGIQKSLQAKVQQLSSQVNDVSLRQSYPGLGNKLYVTYDGNPWQGKAGKQAGENWVSLYIYPLNIGDYTEAQFKQILAAMQQQNFIPYLKLFGVAGPYNQGFGIMNDGAASTQVLYFQQTSKPRAEILSALVARVISRPVPIKFLDLSGFTDNRHLILEQSGLDMQLVLAGP